MHWKGYAKTPSENLYQSYFIKSLDIGNENILANIGKENGINENQIRSAFYVPTEADKKFQCEHEYSEDHTQLENGKVRHLYSLKKKKKPN